ncbi:MAG: excalibur calcium-binding domain-containing protein [Mesorhizobium sp.]|nr:MAG: excalibur calcium-binding domain-containing protein [Mesorhizobium sp.]TIM07774.1 MAG: excalibur calcium-binding domain-containing protein [Mesorhizobium sp.]
MADLKFARHVKVQHGLPPDAFLFDALLNQCPATALVACNPLRTVPHISKLDRDGDGTPCETLC